MRKTLIFVMFLFITLGLLVACADEDRSFTIDKVTIDAQISEQGIIYVSELFTYTFDGTYEGMTRAIHSDASEFKAYVVDENETDPTIDSNNLTPLTTEKDDGTYKVYSDSANESKQVLYQYQVEGSVNKYTDIGEVTYAFFDHSNETDLHDVTIMIHTPERTIAEDTHYFLDENDTGELSFVNHHIHYENDVLKAGTDSMIHFIFPTSELSKMEVTKNKAMKERILAAEEELLDRTKKLDERMQAIHPLIVGLLIGTLVITVFMLVKHPRRYKGDQDETALLALFEQTDLLFVHYIAENERLTPQSIIAALFSLKQQGIVTLQKVKSKQKKEETTYRFTWKKTGTYGDAADEYLRTWLFTEHDWHGDYFLLESIIDNKEEKEAVREERAEYFETSYKEWERLVKERESYQQLRKPFRAYSFLSIGLVMITIGLFYYFMKVEPIGKVEQFILPLILGVLGVVGLLFNRNKWILSLYYLYLITVSVIAFSFTMTGILTMILFGITFLATLLVPTTYFKRAILELNQAMKQAYHLMHQGRYPVGSDLQKIEKRLFYAIVLGAGKAYAEQCGGELFLGRGKLDYPLLHDPLQTADSFQVNNMVFYSTAALASTTMSTTTISSTGGGGAGAF